MGIIEKAAERLEQLRKAGVDTPPRAADPGAELPVANPPTDHVALGRAPALQPVQPGDAAVAAPASRASATPKVQRIDESGRRGKTVEIDLAALAAGGYVTPDAQRSQIADEFRVLKRPIIKNAQKKPESTLERGNCVMVTSALPGEGKSFAALNLAMSIASEVDSTVLLVDADVANPNLMKRLRLPSERGLLDLLTSDNMDLGDLLLRTNVDKLTLLPAGSAHRRATEMLASAAMAELVKEMSTRYADRIIVFDSPPLLVTTEARVLASHMGQIILVVEADVTTQGAVLKALETVENCPIVLTVLNKAPRTDVGSYYGYGFYGATT